MPVTTEALLRRLRDQAKTSQEKGELFERFVRAYLRFDPYYGQLFSNVWRWYEWPGRGKRTDTGIDLVAEEKDTGVLWAIQTKDHESPIDLKDIATFLALSSRKEFGRRMLVTTSSLTTTAEEAAREHGVIVLTLSDILESPIYWDAFNWKDPENLARTEKKTPRRYQLEAVEAAISGFQRTDRGKLIMPPGTGKTFVALQIAERLVGPGGYVLFLAPSIALVEQTLRAWLADARVPLRPFAVTSDQTVGREEDSLDRTTVLTIPPTTIPEELARVAGTPDPERMTVVVCTYHSIDVIANAQRLGLPQFQLIIADEAHRTTGIAREEEQSYYLKVHQNDGVWGAKRLYMTATPRVFVPRLKKKLEELEIDYYSMDDDETFGPEFFRYGFGQAVDEGHLSDYKVVVFAISEADVQRELFDYLQQPDSPEVQEATKIIGTWKALSGQSLDRTTPPLRRAVVFASRVADSKRFADQFATTTTEYRRATGEAGEDLRFEGRHIDGTMSATVRKELLDWLRGELRAGEARILTNAKVLTEGIDVPALDAVVFLAPRRSVVDVVQAVGRVMRRAHGKQYGYVVIPVIVDPNRDVTSQLDENEQFRAVWEVLTALRSIDDRFDALVREVVIRRHRRGDGTSDGAGGSEDDVIIVTGNVKPEFTMDLSRYIYAKTVERVGDRRYLEMWGKDVTNVSARIETHVQEALTRPGDFGDRVRKEFSQFVKALHAIINPSVTEDDARALLVQHIVTKPIFDALFGEYTFLKENPVAQGLDQIASLFESFIAKETRTLESFYRQVRVRAHGIDKETERQDFLRQLYDTFFNVAFPKTAERLGIAYTPVEVVDFLVRSADVLLQQEFQTTLASDGIVILEPFAGTGTFVVRLMQHLQPDALVRKYHNGEIWANEILLLPYYITLANIESTYYEMTGRHEPFPNLLLVDSFQLMENKGKVQVQLFPEQYTELMAKQRDAKINVVLSNPPWFARRNDENVGIRALKYSKLDKRIRETYARYSTGRLKSTLYDSYIRAIRMATDRIENKGVIAFVTNNGFLDGNNADGLRKCLSEDFVKIYILNLRGNARTSGEPRRQEGGNIFGQGSRAGVTLVLLVKDRSRPGPAEIYYHDIGDYLSREQKLEKLSTYRDITGVTWQRITPNAAHDWLNQRSEEFGSFLLMGSKGKNEESTIFALYSLGLNTSRDSWVYNFSESALAQNVRRMIEEFNRHVEKAKTGQITSQNIDDELENDSKKISWSSDLKPKVLRGTTYSFETAGVIATALYRPFVKENVYFSHVFNARPSRLPQIFPQPGVENLAIALRAPGNSKPFSALMVNGIPDLHLLGDTVIFPLYTYVPPENVQAKLFDELHAVEVPSGQQYVRQENITDWALQVFRERYGENVTKEDIFYYVYGLLHSNDYRERYDNDLLRSLPRIPYVASPEDFTAFRDAGQKLARLHAGFESVEEWPLEEECRRDPQDPETYRVTKMAFGRSPDGEEDKTVIRYNEFVTLRGIPLDAYNYVLGDKSAIEWVLERYQHTRDKNSGIKNDPNLLLDELGDRRYIISLLKRVVRISMETLQIVKSLPPLKIE